MLDNIVRNRPRVLVVDNEERTVKLFGKLLDVWKYAAVIAEGTGKSLIEDAIKKAENFRCQMALVDMRLIDNFDDDDISGLELIEKIRPAETIIVSAFGTLQSALDIVQNRGAADFFEKGDDLLHLKDKLEKLAEQKCFASRPIPIRPSEILATARTPLFESGVSIEYHDQIRDVLVRLFPKALSLKLEKMSSIVASDFSTVPRPRSLILLVREDDLQPVIVKLARSSKIHKEVQRFNQYIRGRLVGQYKPTLEEHVELWDIGGIKLSYVGSLEQTFVNFVSRRPINEIQFCLEHFFTQTWSEHYRRAKDEFNVSLFRLYCKVWDRDWIDRASNFVVPDPSAAMDFEIWKKASIVHPLAWFRQAQENEGGTGDPSMVRLTRTAVTHGDLHADNLVIDDSQHGWVMDFERTGEGHALQDFIELESDIITRIACAREEFPAFYRFCLALVSGNSIDDIEQDNLECADAETRKVLDTIAIIRRLAVQCTKITDIRQYLIGLYFNLIFRATIVAREQQRKNELRVWMLANILCHRLAHWGDAWPPEEWEKMSSQAEES